MTEKYKQIDVSYDFKGNHISNFAIISSATAPANPKTGYVYHDSVHDVISYYDGTAWKAMPYLDGQYKLPIGFIPVLTGDATLDSASDSTIPTTLLLKECLDTKIDKDSVVTDWQETPSNDNLPSEKLVADTIDSLSSSIEIELEDKLDDEQLVTSWGQEYSDDNIPSEKLVKDTIDDMQESIQEELNGKVDDEQIIGTWEELNPSETQIASALLTSDSLDSKVDDSQITSVVTSDANEIPSGLAVTLALANKTDVTMAIPTWREGTIYNQDSTVLAGTKLFISLVDGNVDIDPFDDTEHEYWTEISGSGGGGGGSTVNGKTIVFGNASDTEYELVHNLSTYDFIWSLRTTNEPREYVQARIQAINRTKVKVLLTNPPGINALTLNLVALRSSVSPTVVDDVTIIEPSETWTYANDTGNPLFIQTFDENGNQIYGDISQYSYNDFNPVITRFTTPQNGHLIVIKSPYVYEFTDSDTWIISHNLGMLVGVQCFDDTDGQITGNVVQNTNSCVITFAERKTGYAVVVVPTLAIEFTNESEWTVEHNLNRYVAIQTYDMSGDQLFTNLEQNGNTASATFTSPKSGYVLIF